MALKQSHQSTYVIWQFELCLDVDDINVSQWKNSPCGYNTWLYQLTTYFRAKKTDLNPTPQRSVPFTWNPPNIICLIIVAFELTPCLISHWDNLCSVPHPNWRSIRPSHLRCYICLWQFIVTNMTNSTVLLTFFCEFACISEVGVNLDFSSDFVVNTRRCFCSALHVGFVMQDWRLVEDATFHLKIGSKCCNIP